MKKSLFLVAILSLLCPAMAAVTVTEDFSLTIQRGFSVFEGAVASPENLQFKALAFTSDADGGAITLSSDGTADGMTLDLTGKGTSYSGDTIEHDGMNLYFDGTGTTTITGVKIDNSKDITSAGVTKTYFALVVASGGVVFDGVTGDNGEAIDLQQNISVGTAWTDYNTAEGTAPAVLTIQGGSKITTSAYYNGVGSNGSKGTINVIGEGTEFKTQQITLGAGTSGLVSVSSPSSEARYYDQNGERLLYWYPVYLYEDSDYQELVAGKTAAGYGTINILQGAHMYVGEGNTNGSSNNKLQIFNGEINVDGAGSSLVVSNSSVVTLDKYYSGAKSFLNITNGGIVQTGENSKLVRLSLGMMSGEALEDTETAVRVSGQGSRLDLAVGINLVLIGGLYGGSSGSGSKVTLEALEGGYIDINAQSDIYVNIGDMTGSSEAQVNITATGDDSSIHLTSTKRVHILENAVGSNSVSLSALSGGSVTVDSTYTIYAGLPTSGENKLCFIADGKDSSVTLQSTSQHITFNNYNSPFMQTVVSASNGAVMEILAAGVIYMGANTSVSISNGSVLRTAGEMKTDKSVGITIGADSIWRSEGSVTNEGTIDIYHKMEGTNLSGAGDTHLHIYSGAITTTSVQGGPVNPILSLSGSMAETQELDVIIHLDDALQLLGSSYDFLTEGGNLTALKESQIRTINGGLNPQIDFANGYISFDGGQIGFDAHGWTEADRTLTGCTFDYWRSTENTTEIDGINYVPELTVENQAALHTVTDGVVVDKGAEGYTTYSQHVAMGEHVAGTVSLMKETDSGYESIDSQGRILLFNTASRHVGDESGDALIGFTGTQVGQDVEIKELPNGVAVAEAADVVLVTSNGVELEKLTMNAGQRFELKNGGSLTLKGAHVLIGGGDVEAKDFTSFEVDGSTYELKNEDKNLNLDSQSSLIAAHTTLVLDATENDASFAGWKLKGGEGSLAVQEGAQIILKSDKGTASFGSTAADAMHITMDNASLSGTGYASHFTMNGGSLTAGNSPGVLTVDAAEFRGTTWTFYFITDATTWQMANTETNSADGAFSQLKVDKGGALADHVLVNIAYQTTTGETSSAGELDAPLEAGFSVKLIDGAQNIINNGSAVNALTLPQLQDGLLWDTSTLFSDGVIRIINEVLADSTRIANTLVSAADTTTYFGRMARNHAQDARLDRANVWAGGFGTFLNHSDRGGRTGFEYNTAGYAIGADTRVAENTVAGIAFGQSFGKHKPNRGNSFFTPGKIDQDGLLAAIYSSSIFPCAKVKEDKMVLDFYAAYGHYDNESRRNFLANGREATAEWCENTWSLGAVLTRRMQLENDAWLSPFVGIEYKYAGMNDMTEHGSTDVRYAAAAYQNLALSVGLGYSKSIALGATQSLTPYISTAYVGDAVRQDGKVTARSKSGTWTDRSAAHGRHALQINAGAYWKLDEEWGVRAGYTAEIRDGADDHNVNVGVHYSF